MRKSNKSLADAYAQCVPLIEKMLTPFLYINIIEKMNTSLADLTRGIEAQYSAVIAVEYQELEKQRQLLTPQELAEWQKNRAKFWEENINLFLTLEQFKECMEDAIEQVIKSAIKRKISGRPAMCDQSTVEHLAHMKDHLTLWENDQIGDETSVNEQAKHVLCRAMLAYFTFNTYMNYTNTQTAPNESK